MRARLPTTTVHRVINSPIGALLDTPTVERLRLDRLPAELRLARIAAAASLTAAAGVDEFFAALGARPELGPRGMRRLERGLSGFARALVERDEVLGRWERAFWGDGWPPPRREELVELEMERREKCGRVSHPTNLLGFLASEPTIPLASFAIPSPGEIVARWTREIADPDRLYTVPAEPPAIERSRAVAGPAGFEYLLRFRSPSSFRADGPAYARVYEPESLAPDAATFIYASGPFSAGDQVGYWPEEEYMGRNLAAHGHRVALLDLPGHGRRVLPGHYSGETYLGTAPEGLFRLHAAGALEMAVLVRWAREQGARSVGVGGLGAGALVAQAVAGRCGRWPRSMRPDAVFLAAPTCRLDEVAWGGSLSRLIGLDRALPEAGWTREALAELRDLLDPPAEPAISPENIFAMLGAEDTLLPCSLGKELMRRWRVPHENVTILPTGHFGLQMHLARRSDAQLVVTRALHRALHHRAAA
ncbi:alpha/beta hydrolase [Polyangium aurulentum]|uniref:alpha/beta hydrolase n=1 Tax=Polyangium aurulentum TaxID=2567896 RepID=UPI0010AE7B81|nr:alpha/beta hydrolase [Polyangium aurulentum]UQA63060.1 hypothetical protein E8A73_022405 [Polyangium aurulentum]